MVKTKTLRKRRTSSSKRPQSRRKKSEFEITLREDVGIQPFHAAERLRDPKFVGTAIMQSLIENDPEGVIDAVEGHLEALNVSHFSKEAGVPRSTLYKLLKNKNVTIKTLAKILHAAHYSEK